MKRILILALIVFVGGTLALWIFSQLQQVPEPVKPLPLDPLYTDKDAEIDARVEDLLSYMTLQEKIGQMALVEKNSVQDDDDLSTYSIGGMLSGMGAKPEVNTKEGWKTMVERFTVDAKQNRLGIPVLYGIDAIHGHSNVPEATIFPHAIALGATDDADLVRAVAKATALEMFATGITWNYAPNLDLPQDIRWGRVFEAFSDDPVRAAKLGEAYIEGMHNEEGFVLATPKHYIGAGGMIFNSSSNPDFLIDQGSTAGSEEYLREVYLPPFKAAVDEGVYGVLVGLNAWAKEDAESSLYSRFEHVVPQSVRKTVLQLSLSGDTKLAAHKYLVTDVLKGELGFKGFAVSDWYGVYEIPGGEYKAAVAAINAGIDMIMLPFEYEAFIKNVTEAVRKGEITQERIDDAVRRILRAKFASGLFDDQEEVPLSIVGSEAHKALAREVVSASQVLLKNENNVLPLSPAVAHVRVVGSAADNVGMQSGGWTVEWQGIDGNGLPNSTSILQSIKETVSKKTVVEYSKEGVFASSTPKAQIGIAIVGEKPYAEGWGDTALPILSGEDREAIKRLQDASEKVIVVLVSGRPLLVSNEVNSWDAFVMAWLPGSQGGGVVDVLFGLQPFVGTLPLPYPKSTQQLPIAPDGTTADGTSVLYPRGFGL